MKLGIVGTGAMGKIVNEVARKDKDFDEIYMIEPTESNPFPECKVDLLIDFSNPKAINSIYEYVREQGGNIPVVIATTGYGKEELEIVKLLRKIAPVEMKSNFSQGIGVMTKLVELAKKEFKDKADIRISETHHTKKKDAPSGTAKTLSHYAGIDEEEYNEKVAVLRMGTVFGEHSVYFALDDEVLEIKHTAFSKKIFATGAIEEGKKLCKK